MSASDKLKADLPVAMAMAGFVGISWYIGVELNIRLFLTFKRKRGVYFWSCALCSWGIILQPVLIILVDFGILRHLWVAMVLIYATWWLMVVPQAVVLYSRLHLVIWNRKHLRYVLFMIIFTAIFISIPTMLLGIFAQAGGNPTVMRINSIWDRIQVSIFFVEETIISVLYVIETRRRLENLQTLGERHNTIYEVMHHLIYMNIFVICLDISLLGLSYSNHFYIQAAYKPCVYGLKLRVEFSILNRLISSLRSSTHVFSTAPPPTHPHAAIHTPDSRMPAARSLKPDEVTLDTLSFEPSASRLSTTETMGSAPTALLRTLPRYSSAPAPLCTNVPLLRNLPHFFPPPTAALSISTPPPPTTRAIKARATFSTTHRLLFPRNNRQVEAEAKAPDTKQRQQQQQHDNVKNDTSAQEQAGKPNSGSNSSNNPQFPTLRFETLGLSGNMKILVLVLLGTLGTVETWFWCKAIWRWWKGAGDEEETDEAKGKEKEKAGGGAGVSNG
ncbi:hypothetical protein GX51_06436 [Blastomyces parvus]|uniref:DUF7703 domain-containing protein n=1 Tax=Blastomyces parvus TaxID=2060905 RepID=A0A2B7WR81_9EURO|nr:hypothetical protein GX51_06436 [Blastomyces parvus]